jgi:hypothetical protein
MAKRTFPRTVLTLERLEDRRLLAGSVIDHYIRIAGIDGEATDHDKGAIVVESFSFGTGQTVAPAPGPGGSPVQKQSLPANFRIQIDGLDAGPTRVIKIDSFTLDKVNRAPALIPVQQGNNVLNQVGPVQPAQPPATGPAPADVPVGSQPVTQSTCPPAPTDNTPPPPVTPAT